MAVAAYSVADIFLELDVDTTVPRDDDVLEVEGTKDGVKRRALLT